RIAGLVKGFDIGQYMEPKEARKADTFIQYGVAATTQAMRDAGLEVSEADAHRVGVIMGAGIGGIGTIEANYQKLQESGARRISPFFVRATIVNMISGQMSIMHG